MNDNVERIDPKKYFVLSKDYLRNSRIDQALPDGWKNYPPLFQGKNSNRKMKMMCRAGVPESLRCAIWITSVVRITNPQQSEQAIEEYGVLGKVPILDHGWDLILSQIFPDKSDENDALLSDFGLGKSYMDFLIKKGVDDKTMQPIPPAGIKSLTNVLCAVQFHLDIQYCPLLPHLTTILLSYMSESYTYATLREMINDSSYYFPLREAQHHAWCKSFADIILKMYPKTAKEMGQNSALSVSGLDPIFKRFFAPLLQRQHVFRVMDLYVTEGYKALFRIGITLIAVHKKELKSMNINNAALWWAEIRAITHSPKFDFDKDVLRRAYRFHGSRLRKRILFPRHRTIARMMNINERWVDENMEFELRVIPPKPLGFVDFNHDKENDELKCTLARPATVRSLLAQWVPHSLLTCKLDLIFSTNFHGRSLNLFYDKVGKSKRTIMLVEVLGQEAGDEKKVIGLYASQAWHRSNHIYGDGGCFLFTITPEPKCYKWRPQSAGSLDDEKNEALMEQFMLSKDKFVAMGGNKNGSCGLRLNDDFTRGESETALGFDNEPLAGTDLKYFDVGLVEVYRFVRSLDGKGVDGEDDEVWRL